MFANFLGEFYVISLVPVFIILLVCWLFLTESNRNAFISVILWTIFRFTGIVPLASLIYFHNIRLLAYKMKIETETKQKTFDI